MARDRIGRRLSRTFGGPAALLVVGVAVGAFLHYWMSTAVPIPDSEALHDEESEHEAGDARIASIPVEAQRLGGVATALAKMRPMRITIRFTGDVAADRSRVARISPLAQGVVERVFVQLGDRVERGDPLLSYDNVELGLAVGDFVSADAELQSSRKALELQEAILARSSEMLDVGAIAQADHEISAARYRDSEARVEANLARVSRHEEQLHRFGLSEEEVAKLKAREAAFHRTASVSTLRAPLPGIVTSIDASPGEAIDGASQLLTVTDLSTVWIVADVFEGDIASVRVGDLVEGRVPAYPDSTFRGRIDYVGDAVNLETRSTLVRCVVENPGIRLKLGMSVTIDIRRDVSRERLTVPARAVQAVRGQSVVYVKLSESTFEMREVETGLEDSGWIEIRSGLSPGLAVIAQGSFYAKTAILRESIGDHH